MVDSSTCKTAISASVVLFGIGALCVSYSATASAQAVEMPDISRMERLDNGQEVTLTLSEISVNSVPNMAGTPFTREGFISAKAQVAVSAALDDADNPVGAVSLLEGLQIGCQSDVSSGVSLGLEGTTDVSSATSISPSVNGSLSVTPSVTGELGSRQSATAELGVPPSAGGGLELSEGASAGLGSTGTAGVGVEAEQSVQVGQSITPSISGTIKPGAISTAALINQSMGKEAGSTHVRDASIHVDACAGPANVRIFATVTVTTGDSVDSFTVYSEVKPL